MCPHHFGGGGWQAFLSDALILLPGASDDELAVQIVYDRISYRSTRVAQDPSQSVFLEGWLNRDYALLEVITR